MNSNDNTFELLVDKVDGLHTDAEDSAFRSLISGNPEAAIAFERLQSVVSGIREAGTFNQVSVVRKQFKAGVVATKAPAKIVGFNTGRMVLRVAAAVILIVISATTYKLISVTDTGVYNKYYSSYELSTSRNRATSDQLDAAYRNKEWQKVIALAGSAPTNKEKFLLGMANLELSQYEVAINNFNLILSQSGKDAEAYFVDEAQYYLAMAYLASDQSDLALPILNRIKKDSNHLFHSTVESMSVDLKVLEVKN